VSPDLNLDVPSLLAPFEGESPCGTDPREDASGQSLYYRLRDARAEARDAERRADGGDGDDSGASPQQWRTVRELSTKILRERAKDLEVAAWLTEALVREAGVAGLTAGATIMRELAAAFWDSGLFPTPDEDGIATLVAPISGLSGVTSEGTLAQPLRKQVMFTRPDGSEVTFWQFAQSVEVEGIGDAARKKARLDAGVPVFSALDKEARSAGAKHFVALRGQLDEALLAWNTMASVLDEKAGVDAPSTGRVKELLASFEAGIGSYAPPRVAGGAEEEQAAPEQTTAEPGAAGPVQMVAASRPVTREDMLGELARIADYFRKSEPQSPLSLTLEEAVRRARLSWPELLAEVVSDTATRNAMLTQLGIRPPPPPEA